MGTRNAKRTTCFCQVYHSYRIQVTVISLSGAAPFPHRWGTGRSSVGNTFLPGAGYILLPVSYTHLDVYKRQLLSPQGFIGRGTKPTTANNLFLYQLLIPDCRLSIVQGYENDGRTHLRSCSPDDAVCPVSYTHLAHINDIHIPVLIPRIRLRISHRSLQRKPLYKGNLIL